MSALLDRQRAIRGADSALREADLPLYADVVVALHRLQVAVEQMAKGWGNKPPSEPAKRAMHYAIDAKELISCFQENPVAYEKMRRQAQQEMHKLIEFARQFSAPQAPPENDGFFPIDDIDF